MRTIRDSVHRAEIAPPHGTAGAPCRRRLPLRHAGDLFDASREWLKMTLDRLFVDDRHHAVCTSGCLDCIISFEGRYQLPEKLDRVRAWDALRQALDIG